jgi:hypothetical protein
MVNNAKTRLLALPSVGYLPLNGRHVFTLGDDFTLHLKKLDGMQRSIGILTQQRLEFLEQRHPQLQLPFGGERTFIEGGYCWHDDARIAFGVYVVCPVRDRTGQRISNLWVLPLRGESASGAAEVIPISPIMPSDEDARRVVLPRLRYTEKENREATDGQ